MSIEREFAGEEGQFLQFAIMTHYKSFFFFVFFFAHYWFIHQLLHNTRNCHLFIQSIKMGIISPAQRRSKKNQEIIVKLNVLFIGHRQFILEKFSGSYNVSTRSSLYTSTIWWQLRRSSLAGCCCGWSVRVSCDQHVAIDRLIDFFCFDSVHCQSFARIGFTWLQVLQCSKGSRWSVSHSVCMCVWLEGVPSFSTHFLESKIKGDILQVPFYWSKKCTIHKWGNAVFIRHRRRAGAL